MASERSKKARKAERSKGNRLRGLADSRLKEVRKDRQAIMADVKSGTLDASTGRSLLIAKDQQAALAMAAKSAPQMSAGDREKLTAALGGGQRIQSRGDATLSGERDRFRQALAAAAAARV